MLFLFRGVGCIFVEMISGFPLFPGVKSTRDQLNKIFKVYITGISLTIQSTLFLGEG